MNTNIEELYKKKYLKYKAKYLNIQRGGVRVSIVTGDIQRALDFFKSYDSQSKVFESKVDRSHFTINNIIDECNIIEYLKKKFINSKFSLITNNSKKNIDVFSTLDDLSKENHTELQKDLQTHFSKNKNLSVSKPTTSYRITFETATEDTAATEAVNRYYTTRKNNIIR
jgi:hypothetical protein